MSHPSYPFLIPFSQKNGSFIPPLGVWDPNRYDPQETKHYRDGHVIINQQILLFLTAGAWCKVKVGIRFSGVIHQILLDSLKGTKSSRFDTYWLGTR